ncbi:MAG: CC_3452 family protein [Stenotrophomonas sp.]
MRPRPPPGRVIVDGAAWRCEGATCTASGGANQPATRACRRVVAKLGPVTGLLLQGRGPETNRPWRPATPADPAAELKRKRPPSREGGLSCIRLCLKAQAASPFRRARWFHDRSAAPWPPCPVRAPVPSAIRRSGMNSALPLAPVSFLDGRRPGRPGARVDDFGQQTSSAVSMKVASSITGVIGPRDDLRHVGNVGELVSDCPAPCSRRLRPDRRREPEDAAAPSA